MKIKINKYIQLHKKYIPCVDKRLIIIHRGEEIILHARILGLMFAHQSFGRGRPYPGEKSKKYT